MPVTGPFWSFIEALLDEEFPVDVTPTPEEKAAKKAAKKEAKLKAQAEEAAKLKAEKAEKIAKFKAEHPEWENYNPGVPHHGCFGFLNGHLILGAGHHQAIMAMLLDGGWTWQELFEATQVWGWYTINAMDFDSPWFDPDEFYEPSVSVSFVSDAAIMQEEAAEACVEAFKEVLGVTKVTGGEFMEDRDVRRHGREYGGDFDRHYKGEDGELVLPSYRAIYDDVTPLPPPPSLEKELVPA